MSALHDDLPVLERYPSSESASKASMEQESVDFTTCESASPVTKSRSKSSESDDIHDLGHSIGVTAHGQKSEECPVASTLRKLSLHVDVASCAYKEQQQGVWKGRFYVTRCDVVS